jgi:chorismate mutase / prephenate dehydratase
VIDTIVIDTMLSDQSDLEELRRRLDAIDDRLQDLLIERLEIVSHVAAEKRQGSVPPHVPAREAQIIRRLATRRGDVFPTGPLVRIWRELLGATTRAQGPFGVGAYAPQNEPGAWDLARDHYGSHAPMTAYQSTLQVIRAVADRTVAVGVLPLPQDGESDPWWVHLLSRDVEVPRVIGRLPFGPPGNARLPGGDALAIGYDGVQLPSGSDRTLLATENAVDISHGRFATAFSGLGMTCTLIASYSLGGTVNTLIELDGFVTLADPRLAQLRERIGPDLLQLLTVGFYPVPLPRPNWPASGATQTSAGQPTGHGAR